MRILLGSEFYPPLIGGATGATHLLARGLARRGHDVTVATSWQVGARPFEMEDAVAVHRLRGLTMRLPAMSASPYRRIPPPFPDPELVWHLRRLITRVNPNVVHCYGWISYSGCVALTRTEIPLVLSARDYGDVCAKRTLVREGRVCSGPAARKCMGCAAKTYGGAKGSLAVGGVLGGRVLLRRRITGLHSVSSYVGGVLDEHLLLQGTRKPLRIPHEVLPDWRAPATVDGVHAKILDGLPQEPFILFVGAFRRIKGLEPLFRAYEGLSDRPPLVLIGTRSADMPTSFPEGSTVFYDAPNPTVRAVWDRALFGVAPSLLPEALGNVVHEAMSRGRPVIGTHPGGHSDMIEDGVNGFLIPPGDVVALRNAMRRLVEDEALRTHMAAAALSTARRFTEDAVLPRIEAFLEHVVNQKQQRHASARRAA